MQNHSKLVPRPEPKVTVDNIEVAQFIYLLLHNGKIRDVIDTVTSKAVLILGRFTKSGWRFSRPYEASFANVIICRSYSILTNRLARI